MTRFSSHEGSVADLVSGLSAPVAADRLREYGPNELATEVVVTAWRRFLAQFHDALVILLLVASGISLLVWFVEGAASLPYEAIVIVSVVLLNALMGFIQEGRAEAALAALRTTAAPEATVIRDGSRCPPCERGGVANHGGISDWREPAGAENCGAAAAEHGPCRTDQ